MKIRRHGFLYRVFLFGKFDPFVSVQKDKRKRTSFDDYLRVMTMGVTYHAYLTLMTWIPSFALTLLANVITIPFGFGFSILYPHRKFIVRPFEFEWRGSYQSWSRILVPLWVMVGNLGLVLTNNPIKKFDLNVVLALNALVAIGYILVIKYSYSRRMHIVEFVD